MILPDLGYLFAFFPALIGAMIMVAIAVLFNNMEDVRSYPKAWRFPGTPHLTLRDQFQEIEGDRLMGIDSGFILSAYVCIAGSSESYALGNLFCLHHSLGIKPQIPNPFLLCDHAEVDWAFQGIASLFTMCCRRRTPPPTPSHAAHNHV